MTVWRSMETARRWPARLPASLAPFSLGLAAGLGLSAAEATRRAFWAHRRAAQPTAASPESSPADISPRGWRQLIVLAIKEFNQDKIPAIAGSVTFFFLLALFPAISAFVSIYGLFADVSDVQSQVGALEGLLPSGAISVLSEHMERLAGANDGSLSLAFIVSLLVSLWSANSGVKALLAALNIAYETKERRGFVKLNLVSLAFTFGGVILAVVLMAATVAAPAALGALHLQQHAALTVLRWPLLFGLLTVLVSVLYRFGPSRERPRWRWITPGGAFAALAWMAVSALFSWYVANFGHYDQTYGSLGAIVGFLTWIWLSLMVVMLGAELNAAIEAEAAARQTRREAEHGVKADASV